MQTLHPAQLMVISIHKWNSVVVSPLFAVPNDNRTVIKYTTKHGAKTK